MATTFDIQLPHYSRGFHLITRDIVSQLPALPESGLLVVFIKHTSAGLTINENADPDHSIIFPKPSDNGRNVRPHSKYTPVSTAGVPAR